MKVRPALWESLTEELVKQGVLNKGRFDQVNTAKTTYYKPVELKKVNGIQSKDEGNTTLPVIYEGIESMAILDSGAGISIATKSIWEKWGRPTVRRTRMNLQLADGNLENPIGLLENITVTSCGIEYEHSFAIVDFGQNTNYEVILGRPFMRQFQMVQDWGYNYLYLRHETAITRVNLKNHTHRDVTHMPMEEFDSASSENSDSSDEPQQKNMWMCGASKASVVTDGSEWCKDVMDEAYVPIPYPEEKFEPVEWLHCLATLDICTLNHRTKFCDEDGYDIIPLRMAALVDNHWIEDQAKQDTCEHITKIQEKTQAHVMTVLVHSDEDSDELLVKPFTISCQLLTETHANWIPALIDSGSECNVLSYDTWDALGKPELVPSPLSFINF